MNRVPKMQHHKASGQAVVRLNGKDFYLGKHGTDAADRAYRRIIADYLATGCVGIEPEAVTVEEVLAVAWQHVESYYVKNGKPTSEQLNFKRAFDFIRELYGETPAADFGPVRLKAVRDSIVDAGFTRRNVNKHVFRIRHAFRLAVEAELIDVTVYQRLLVVKGLKKGKTAARDNPRVKPVTEEQVKATKKHCSRQVAAMIDLQWLVGMRPNEVLQMRAAEIDMSGDVWTYVPASHKTEHHDIERTIPLGPKCQDVIRPFLTPDADKFLFSPIDAEEERLKIREANRTTPKDQGNRRGTNKKAKPKRSPKPKYTTDSYRRHIERACDAAGVERWTPHRLRHAAAKRFRARYGIDVARTLLGHTSVNQTEIYAEADHKQMQSIARDVA
ncbi:MAG: tyrosine-type recombinase/integrase [Phycisphaerae bacterium]